MNFSSLKEKVIKIILGVILLIFISSPKSLAENRYQAWNINNFYSEIKVGKDGSLAISEIIEVNFYTPKHGIYRTIPIKYKDKWGNNLNLRIKVNSITNEKNKPYPNKITYEGANIKIRIGDPQKTITGRFTYKIDYIIKRALIYGENQDEIYWNVTGTEWEVPIRNVAGKVILPPEINRDIETYCWTGPFGSTQKECRMDTQNNLVIFNANDFLTISIKFPSGYITKPNLQQKVIWFFQDNWFLFLPIFVFIFMFLLWFYKGRDPAGRGTIIPEFDSPDNLRPTEVGLLLDNKIQTKDITATIIDLAVKGYLKIIEKKDEIYDLVLLKKDYRNDPELKPYEITIINDIFGNKAQVSLDDLKNKFYKYLDKIKKEVSEGLVKGGYYKNNPVKIRNFWVSISTVLFFLGLGVIFELKPSLPLFLSYFISLGIIMGFGLAMTKRTPKGAQTLEKIKGLRLYINTAEKYRIKFQEKENIFEKFLPYAMVFGLADKWAAAFKDVYKNPPSWYEGYQGPFTSSNFIHSMNSFDNKVGISITSAPSSGSGIGGGGGFSGGGFGGGGGGSW